MSGLLTALAISNCLHNYGFNNYEISNNGVGYFVTIYDDDEETIFQAGPEKPVQLVDKITRFSSKYQNEQKEES